MTVQVQLPLTLPILVLLLHQIRLDAVGLEQLDAFLVAVMLGFFDFVAFAVYGDKPTPIINAFVHLMRQESEPITARI